MLSLQAAAFLRVSSAKIQSWNQTPPILSLSLSFPLSLSLSHTGLIDNIKERAAANQQGNKINSIYVEPNETAHVHLITWSKETQPSAEIND